MFLGIKTMCCVDFMLIHNSYKVIKFRNTG